MNGKEFNQKILNFIQNDMTGKVRLAFKYRHGLADGVWYKLDEICAYLNITTDQCIHYLAISSSEVCEWLESECDSTLNPGHQFSELKAIVGECELLSDSAHLNTEEVSRNFQEAAEKSGYSFGCLGRSLLPSGEFGRFAKEDPLRRSQYLVLIEPKRIRWIQDIVAILFRHREELGEHSSGSHIVVLGYALELKVGKQIPIFCDIEVFDTPFAFNWTVESGLRVSPSVEEPWLYKPLS